MSTPEETMYQQVLVHIQKKENSRARDLLTRLIKINPNNTEYWLWMSAVTETTRERIFCLKEALRLDPIKIPSVVSGAGEARPDRG